MGKKNIAINGFGRIGRNFLRIVLQDAEHKHLNVVVINTGNVPAQEAAHLFKYDTLMGTYQASVEVEGTTLIVDNHRIVLIAQLDPAACAWYQYDIDWVVECSGHFTHRDGAQKHLNAGARAVLISAPGKNEDITIIPGVNEQQFDPAQHTIVSLGSCTTNAIVPMLKVLHDAFTIKRGYMTTVHAYTNSQALLDNYQDNDVRRSRAAGLNIIPTSTGATDVVHKIIPALNGAIEGVALRVPVAKVSIIDLVVVTQKELSVQGIHAAFISAQRENMQGIVHVSSEPLVSSDYSGDSHSVVIDGLLTSAQGNMGKIFGWYDNEWGYSMRLKDFLVYVCGGSL